MQEHGRGSWVLAKVALSLAAPAQTQVSKSLKEASNG